MSYERTATMDSFVKHHAAGASPLFVNVVVWLQPRSHMFAFLLLADELMQLLREHRNYYDILRPVR